LRSTPRTWCGQECIPSTPPPLHARQLLSMPSSRVLSDSEGEDDTEPVNTHRSATNTFPADIYNRDASNASSSSRASMDDDGALGAPHCDADGDDAAMADAPSSPHSSHTSSSSSSRSSHCGSSNDSLSTSRPTPSATSHTLGWRGCPKCSSRTKCPEHRQHARSKTGKGDFKLDCFFGKRKHRRKSNSASQAAPTTAVASHAPASMPLAAASASAATPSPAPHLPTAVAAATAVVRRSGAAAAGVAIHSGSHSQAGVVDAATAGSLKIRKVMRKLSLTANAPQPVAPLNLSTADFCKRAEEQRKKEGRRQIKLPSLKVCVCVCVCARACVCACVRVCVCVLVARVASL
jgi:hypothetical protein